MAVAEAMSADLGIAGPQRPSFIYHLGDVVYFNGQIRKSMRSSMNRMRITRRPF
jgi:hypothetical protein